jgi:hypothetical protein
MREEPPNEELPPEETGPEGRVPETWPSLGTVLPRRVIEVDSGRVVVGSTLMVGDNRFRLRDGEWTDIDLD